MKSFSGILLLFFCLSSVVAAQQRPVNQRPPQDNSAQFMAEAIALPAASPDSARIIVMFRMRYDMLRFQPTASSPIVSQGEFSAAPVVSTEVKDAIGIIRSQKEWSDSIYAGAADVTIRTRWISGVTECVVAVGVYSVQITVGDRAGSVSRRVKLSPFAAPPRRLRDAVVMFARVIRDFGHYRIEPVISNNDAPFEQNSITAVISLCGAASASYSYELTPVSTDDWGELPMQRGNSDVLSHVRLGRISTASVRFPPHRLQFETAPDASSGLTLLLVPLPANGVAPGQYRLKITSESGDTLSRMFNVRWENMPASLGSGAYSAEAMRYILTDKEHEDISSGTEQEKRRAIIDYWRKLDPTPFTLYNEAMAEYFRRVDAAGVQFSTLAERDGAKSERGKIYILYGWPDSVAQPESPGKFKEIWTYSRRTKQQFVFEQNAAGMYRLTEIR